MKIKGITHTGVTVRCIEDSIPFYRDFLGLKQLNEPNPPVYDPAEGAAVGVKDAINRCCLFQVAPGQILELLQYTQPKSPVDKPLPQNALGAKHVSFTVDSIAEWAQKLKEKGIKYYADPKTCGPGINEGIKWMYFEDPDGIVFEFMELPKGFKNF